MKISAAAIAAAAIAPSALASESAPFNATPDKTAVGDDFRILSDQTRDGVRYVCAAPSALVCSKQIDIEINVKDKTIRHAKFTRGCPGNAIGLCSLIEGMTVDEVIRRLSGINCAGRGTSCPDQLSRVLRSL